MTDEPETHVTEETLRSGDRRREERRQADRRTPVPAWRSPWAFAAYGAAAMLLAGLLLLGGGEEERATVAEEVVTAPARPAVQPAPPPAAAAPPLDAHSVAAFERLLAEGEAAQGRRVHALLFCEGITSVALRSGPTVPASVAALADAEGRVPAASCRWGAAASAPDFLLLVPPDQVGRFAAAPEVVQSFVRRRRVRVELEWLGRSEALALRTAGVLRTITE